MGRGSASSHSPAAEAARGEDDEADHQNEAKCAAANDRTAEVKSAATEQEEQNNND